MDVGIAEPRGLTFAESILDLRLRLGLSQRAVVEVLRAHGVSISERAYVNYETGRSLPEKSKRLRIEHLLTHLATPDAAASSDYVASRTGPGPYAEVRLARTLLTTPARAVVAVPWLRLPGEAADAGTDAVVFFDTAYARSQYGVDPSLLRRYRVSVPTVRSRVRAGDEVLCALLGDRALCDGALYILQCATGTMVRRLRLQPGGFTVLTEDEHPDGPLLEPARFFERYQPVAEVLVVWCRV